MKCFRPLLFCISTFLLPLVSASQCPECETDNTCGAGSNFPVICPEVLPAGETGVYYEEVLTFFMPAEVEDQGVTATLDQIIVSSITGTPFGMQVTVNDDDNTFYPNSGENYGCATLCGTPIQSGNFDISINVLVTVTAFGFEQTLNESFILPLEISQGEEGNSSFTYSQSNGCGELEVDFSALIDGAPNPTVYSWDFGNGNQSDQLNPVSQTYQPGTYTASLETTVYEFVLTQVIVNDVSNDGTGDADELFGVLAPDPYLVVVNENGAAVYTSGTVNGSNNATFSGLSVVLTNPNYSIQIWDSDTITQDDLLGEYNLGDLTAGVFTYNDGGTEGSLVVAQNINSQFIDTQEINVYEFPNGDFLVDETSGILYYDNPELTAFNWILNGESSFNFSASQTLELPGVYQCEVTSIYGCTTLSQEYVLCPELEIGVDYENETFFTANGFESYAWFYNGLEIYNSNSNEVAYQGPGNYAVEITTDYGCEIQSEVLTIDLSTEDIEKITFSIYPNPSSEFIIISSKLLDRAKHLKVYDLSGRLMFSKNISFSSGEFILDISDLPNGTFKLVLESFNGIISSKGFLKQ